MQDETPLNLALAVLLDVGANLNGFEKVAVPSTTPALSPQSRDASPFSSSFSANGLSGLPYSSVKKSASRHSTNGASLKPAGEIIRAFQRLLSGGGTFSNPIVLPGV